MQLNEKLVVLRKERDWTQLQVAGMLKIQRELVSMWEVGSRRPSDKQLEQLSMIFNVELGYLKGTTSESGSKLSQSPILLRGSQNSELAAQTEIEDWLRFLDNWSQIVNIGKKSSKPPRKLDYGPDFSDIRSSSKLSLEVRDYYDLGAFALPDLFTFLDEHEILVCKARLGNIDRNGISGAFYNHPSLGYCILVNTETSRGRQMFTLAHEYAHALFHYGAANCIVSITGEKSSREQFADAFAANLLIPRKGLRQVIEASGLVNNLTESDVVRLASYYKVSYAFMLNRLLFEQYINADQRDSWQKLSPRSLAKQIGMNSWLFESKANDESGLAKYPSSVLRKIRELSRDKVLSLADIAALLNVDPFIIERELFQLAEYASNDELEEIRAFEGTHGSA